MQSLPADEARSLLKQVNYGLIRSILSLKEDVDAPSMIDAIVSHPDTRIQEETCHLLKEALGPMMPWRDIVDFMRSFAEYPHPDFLAYAEAMAQTVPAPWSKTLVETEEQILEGPRINDLIYQMVVTSMEGQAADIETMQQTPATKAWGLCNPAPEAFRPGKIIDQSYRMMACERYMVAGSGDDNESWYTGVCQVCEDEIPNMGSALRHPLNDGGWMGCFCGFRCLAFSSPHDELFKITSMELMEGSYFAFSMAQARHNEDEKEAMSMIAEELEKGPDPANE